MIKNINNSNPCKKSHTSMILAFLTTLVIIISSLYLPLETYAAPDEYPEEILVDIDIAQDSLQKLLATKEIFALVYLCDSFELKSAPDTDSDTIVTVESGQFLQITGISQDDLHYIWYQVRADIGGTYYEGYILRDYLAYSDEDLINWEADNIMSLSISFFSLAPATTEDETQTIPKDIQKFPVSYQDALLALKEKHPNWIFVKMDTQIDWNEAILTENSGNRSLFHAANKDHLLNGSYDSSWAYPTNGTLA